MIRSLPNVGTPLRTIRDPIRWAETLEKLYALKLSILVPEFRDPVSTEDEIRERLLLPAKVLRWMRKEVVDRMNTGMDLETIVHDIRIPSEWLTHKQLQQRYGSFDYIMRDIWRSENGWWDRNPTNLHPAPPSDVGAAILSAISDPERVIQRARELEAEGNPQLAMHVLDLLVSGPESHPQVRDARHLKARLCEKRSETASSYVSRQLYLSSADDLLGRPIEGDSVW